MLPRHQAADVMDRLANSPAVVLTGPRQAGKTTLALELAGHMSRSVYLDLESPSDRARLAEPELYLSEHADDLVILDEVHRAPGIFEALRGIIDRGRREGRASGRFLLLGSASVELLAQSGETLAGRVALCELGPLDASEVGDALQDSLWLRGGFPESLLADDDRRSLRWRTDFVRTYLERDVPQLGPRIPAETLRRLWTMLAHQQGGMLNAAHLARSLAIDGKTVSRYLDLLVDLLLVRRLAPLAVNVGKRLVRAPKVYIRDSGLVHALLGIGDREMLLGHPVAGPSWEGLAIESILMTAGADVDAGFYRTSGGAEIDLVLTLPGGELWAIEVKRTLSPRLRRGFRSAFEDLRPARGFFVYPGRERFPLGERVEATGLAELCEELTRRSRSAMPPMH